MVFKGIRLIDKLVLLVIRRSPFGKYAIRFFRRYVTGLRILLRFEHLKMAVKFSNFVSEMLIKKGAYEPETLLFLRRILDTSDVFVDIGANVGLHSLVASKLCNAKVYSIEAHPKAFLELQSNVLLNECSTLVLMNFPVFDKDQLVEFQIHTSGNLSSSRLKIDDQPSYTTGFYLHAFDFKKFFEAVSLSKIRVMKIDVEGVEDRVLSCIEDTLNKVEIDYMIVEVRPSVNQAIIGFIQDRVPAMGYLLEDVKGNPVSMDRLSELPEHNLVLHRKAAKS